MNKFKILGSLLLSFTAMNVYSQQTNLQNDLGDNSHVTVIESSANNPSFNRVKKLPVFHLANNKRDEDISTYNFIIERQYDTPAKIRLTTKVPMEKNKTITPGKVYYIPVMSVYKDQQSGVEYRKKEMIQRIYSWCGNDACLNSTDYLVKVCNQVKKDQCVSGYDTVKVDFSRIKPLERGETERFEIFAAQARTGGKRIDFSMYNILTKGNENYLIVYHQNIFGKDELIVYPESERKRLEAIANKKNQKEINEDELLVFNETSKQVEPTEYMDVPVRILQPGVNQTGVNSSTSNTSSSTTMSEYNKVIRTENTCLGPFNEEVSTKVLTLPSTRTTTTTTMYTNSSSTRVLESSEDELTDSVQTKIESTPCQERRNSLLLNESLAGARGSLNRADLENDVQTKVIKE